ncbi:mRNA cleavage and polyadenylation factor I/II complex, subunit Pcf11 [Handroanthus impetiginosus]|uniref:mRNA cleavage and polyadenylation factor I/II complex, subunit Pcf11 n=1 Tax=Handroanthus impetiginosus TaxID=429701 RepID=A0A2G9H4K1_9LAMI|nr:mRNA cleavage and polyadenylation factor I/II complex, subunit Pcf11 [Handroanthus impetiginosus]
MDRTSRFQNPMPLSSGSFSKPPPIQNDGVGMKPLPPLILDRFRAMVKEREEELRVFGRGAVLPLNTDEIVRLYEIMLSELTINSKPIITDLTIIAGEQRAHAEGIADAICARIIEVPVDQKLPSLYLLDSIVKNIGKDYVRYFSARLPEVFCEAYAQVHPNMHPAMRHLFGTWSAVFPSSVLQKIEAQLKRSAPANGRSSGLSSSRDSESPGQTHGIHINAKYMEQQHKFGNSIVDTFGTEGVSSTGRAGLTTSGLDAIKKSLPSSARITSPASYRIGHSGSLSSPLEEFGMDSPPKKAAVRVSPSRPGIDHALSRAMGREEETSEWRTRNWQGNSNLKASAAYKYGKKNLNRGHHTAEQLDSNGVEQNIAIRAWQNSEEEEFDWKGMTPALADQRPSNDIYSSLPPGNSMARHSLTTNHAASSATDYRSNLSKPHFSSVTNSSIIEDVPRTSSGRGSMNKVTGVQPNVAGPSDLTSQIHPPSFARESLVLPHQHSQSQFNVKGGVSFSDNSSFLPAGEQKPPVAGNFSNTDGKFGRPSSVSTFSSSYDMPAREIRSADSAVLAKSWHPTNFQSSHVLPSLATLPPQLQIRGQIGMNNTVNTEHHLGSTRSMSQVPLPQIPSQHPGSILMNLQNLPLPSSIPIPSNATVAPPNYGYMAQVQARPIGSIPSMPNLNPPNMSYHVPGAALPGGPIPGTNQALPIGQNIGQVASNPPAGGALSGLISSLMAQGLISLTKQDSVGVDFDQDSLKVRHESAITTLYADLPRQCTSCGLRFKGQEEHSKHMDWHVNKNRMLRNRKTKPSPKWFVSVSMWLSGAEASGTEVVPGFFPAEDTVEKKEDEEMAVPADEDQNACALCGEPFEDFYSDEMEEWMYKGAVYMYALAGSTAGMDRSQLGPIVHAKCRSDSHGISSEDFKKDEGVCFFSLMIYACCALIFFFVL